MKGYGRDLPIAFFRNSFNAVYSWLRMILKGAGPVLSTIL